MQVDEEEAAEKNIILTENVWSWRRKANAGTFYSGYNPNGVYSTLR